MARQGEPWTDAEILRLRLLWANPALSASKIAKMMDREKNSIIGKVHRLGLPKRASPVNPSPEYLEAQEAKKAAALMVASIQLAEQEAFLAEVFGEAAPKVKDGCRWIMVKDLKTRPKDMSIEDTRCNGPIFARCYCEVHYKRAYVIKKPKEIEPCQANELV